MRNLKISHKIFVMMSVLMGIIVLSNAFQIWQMSRINDQSSVIAHGWLPNVEDVSAMNTALADIRVVEYAQITSSSDDEKMQADRQREEFLTVMERNVQEYQSKIDSDKKRELFAEFEKN